MFIWDHYTTQLVAVCGHSPVLEIANRGTKDIFGGPKSWLNQKKVAKVEIYAVFDFCGWGTKADI